MSAPLTENEVRYQNAALADENERLRAALESCESWMDRWTQHVGSCQGGDKCTCGRTAILYEARAAMSHNQQSGETK